MNDVKRLAEALRRMLGEYAPVTQNMIAVEARDALAEYEAFSAAEASDLNAELKSRGMFTLDEMLDDSVSGLGLFDTHKGVVTFDDFCDWVDRKRKEYTAMRLRYEVADREKKDDLYAWVLAHGASFTCISKHLRKVRPTIQAKASPIADIKGGRAYITQDDAKDLAIMFRSRHIQHNPKSYGRVNWDRLAALGILEKQQFNSRSGILKGLYRFTDAGRYLAQSLCLLEIALREHGEPNK